MAQPASTDSPQIVISYHVDDEKWRDRLVTYLDLAVDKFGVLDDRTTSRTQTSAFAEDFLIAVKKAKVLVLLISPKYMASNFFMSGDGFNLLAELLISDVFVSSVIVEELEHEDSYLLRAMPPPFNMTPLAEASNEKQNSTLAQLAREIVNVLEHGGRHESIDVTEPLTTDHLAVFQKSEEVDRVLRRSRKLATGATSAIVTTPALFFALAEDGRPPSDYIRTPQFLWIELTKRGDALYTRLLLEEFPSLVTLGERAGRNIDTIPHEAHIVSANVIKVFELAEEIAARTRRVSRADVKRPQIEVRHLLGALLVMDPDDHASGAQRRLEILVGDLATLRIRFYTFLVDSVQTDDHEEWRRILVGRALPEIDPSQSRQEEPERTQPFQQPTVAGFMADHWEGRDLLGIEADVNALASLVAAYKVEPPLSIGLFGDWGSGKSHFMRQMRKRVELLSQKARESGKPQNELGYYKNIVQIEFNAWHYIEGNLWASLVDHIFANLKLSETEPRKYADERRDELMQKLGLQEEIQDKINAKVQQCEDELRKVNDRKEQAEAELQHASAQLKGFREEVKANLKTLSVPVTFTVEEKELLKRLGIATGSTVTAADVHKNYLELKRGWNSLRAKWKLFRTDRRVVRRYVLSALLVAIVIGGPVLLKLGVLPGLPTMVVSILGAIATLLAAAKPAWAQFQKSVDALEKYDHEVERERQKRITELENEVSALTKEVVAAKLESDTVGKEIVKLKADIENTSSSRILAEFIEDRAAASDYRRHLGLLALIRRDFEKLRDLFEQQRKDEMQGTEVDDKKKINRIVLYIDDLDRCPPDRVVQVLQAIHLLLAFPLFVVVVGVDSRWITRSLQQSYDWLRESDEETLTANHKEAESRDYKRTEVGATPHDYLEKIFQIPFWLRSMNDNACVEFLDGLTKDATDYKVPPSARPQPFNTAEEPRRVPEFVPRYTLTDLPPDPLVDVTFDDRLPGSPRQQKPTEPSVIVQNTPEMLELAPRSLTFSSHEIDYMKQLVPLIGRSPRAVKRFLNCYRLIKVGLTPAEFDEFVGDDGASLSYKAAMILLGVITGTPTVSSYVVEQLKEMPPHTSARSLANLVMSLEKNSELQQQPDARRLHNFFKTHDFGSPTDELFSKLYDLGPRCSRFSFRINRADTLKR